MSCESVGSSTSSKVAQFLTRKIGESVRIGDDVVVTIVGIRGSQIRLGIDAPREVTISREEFLTVFIISRVRKNARIQTVYMVIEKYMVI